ncbi:trefoil factor 2-like [Actinia tenebrosa]|uniref:Trefoil factor 2-like n=1 Tax=Actinia tenebrosa TaxID=6105 RepID=A0A6P8JAS5_ACTTE|nr:trefoil factor 2-like [Actinia tenebrosa]
MNAAIGVSLLLLVVVTNGKVLQFRRGERNPQCNIVPIFREKCGEDGISKEGCTALDCCYGFASLPRIPRCFNKKAGVPVGPPGGSTGPKPPKMQCNVIPPLRARCADDNISKEDCLKKDCCYGFDTLPRIPRCYQQG